MAKVLTNMLSSIAAAALLCSVPVLAAHEHDGAQFGTVHFPTSCNEAAQKRFDAGMRFQHSFWWSRAKQSFEDAIKADPECGIAHWGVALTLLWNPHAAPPAANLPLGLEALRKSKSIGAKSQRERDYIDALLTFYTDYEKVEHRSRLQAYLKAVEGLAHRYPDDDEAQIAYALALSAAAPATDKTYANQLKGAAILEPIFKRQPQHPGVAHYLIHLYDYPPIAAKGLEAAKRYAEIAPAAPHAQHMPSHIFTRVGYWKESIASNVASARAAKANKELHDQLHAMDYLVYAHLQLARDEQARATISEMEEIKGYNPKIRTGPYAVAASQARYMIERYDWKGAASLEVRPSQFAYVDAVAHFARALGKARTGDIGAAKTEIAQLAALRDQLKEGKDPYWSEQVDIQRQVATAWLLLAEAQAEQALAAMSNAADAEDRTEKSIVTPGPLAPARELYGVMLLERGKSAEALAQFEAVLQKEPNRFNAFAGAAAAAERADNRTKAREYSEQLIALAGDVQASRAALVAARQLLENR